MNLETLNSIQPKEPTKEANDALTPAWHSVRTEGPFPPLLLVAPCTGGACYFNDLKDMMDPDQPIYIVEPNTDAKDCAYSSVEDITSRIVELVELHLGDSPIRLCGFSFGGNLAWDLTKQLKKRGKNVEFLILLDSYAKSFSEKEEDGSHGSLSTNRISEIGSTQFYSDHLSKLPSNYQTKLDRLKRLFRKGPQFEDDIRTLFKDYDYETLDSNVYVFCPMDGNAVRRTSDPYLGWGRRVKGNLRIIPAYGTHQNFADKPVGNCLGRSVNSILKH